jgi:hypothetical protein
MKRRVLRLPKADGDYHEFSHEHLSRLASRFSSQAVLSWREREELGLILSHLVKSGNLQLIRTDPSVDSIIEQYGIHVSPAVRETLRLPPFTCEGRVKGLEHLGNVYPLLTDGMILWVRLPASDSVVEIHLSNFIPHTPEEEILVVGRDLTKEGKPRKERRSSTSLALDLTDLLG